MRIISRATLRDFWDRVPDAEEPLKAWFREAERAEWASMMDIKRTHRTASVIDHERVVFNIGGNKYRLVIKVWFPPKAIWIKFIGTHAEYDHVDITKL